MILDRDPRPGSRAIPKGEKREGGRLEPVFYVKGLVWTGSDINDEKYTLLWSWNTKGGQVNAKHAYEVISLDDQEVTTNEWYLNI